MLNLGSLSNLMTLILQENWFLAKVIKEVMQDEVSDLAFVI